MNEKIEERRDPEFERKVRAAFLVPEPNPSFVARLHDQILIHLVSKQAHSQRTSVRLKGSGRPPFWNSIFPPLVKVTTFLILVLVLTWIINNLIPGTNLDKNLPLNSANTVESDEVSPPSTMGMQVTPTPPKTSTPTLKSTSTHESQLLTDNVSANFEYANSRLTFRWEAGDELRYPGPFIGEIFADGNLLGQVDLGALPAGFCDRSWDGQFMAYSYDKTDLTGKRVNPTLRFFSLVDVSRIYEPLPDHALQSPVSFAPNDFRLAFNACNRDGDCGLFIYSLDTGMIKKISNVQFFWAPVWSSEGDQIAVQLPVDESSGVIRDHISVFQADSGATLFEGQADESGSPIRDWGATNFEVFGAERCEGLLQP